MATDERRRSRRRGDRLGPDPLLDGAGEGAAGVEALLDEAQERADAFAAAHAGKVAELDGPGARRRDARARRRCRTSSAAPAPTRCCASPPPPPTPRAARCCSRCRSAARRSRPSCCSSSSSGRRSTTSAPRRCSPTTGLDFCRHHLRTARRYRPHLLSEPEERILAEKALTRSSAWSRLFEEQAAAIAVELPGADEPVALEVALSRLFSPDRDERRTTAESVTGRAAPGLRMRGYIFNTLLADKMVDDRLRSYPHWLASRNLANEASDESVAGAGRGGARPLRAAAPLVPAEGAAARPRPARRLRPHGRGHRRGRADRLGGARKDIVLDSFDGLLARAGRRSRARSSTSRGSTRPVRPGKRGGAFCSYTVPSAAPYVLLNYTSRRRDALTLAHELGHGVHAALGAAPGRLPLRDAADDGRDRQRVRRDARVRPPARGGADAGVAAGAAGGEHRGLDRDGLPAGRHEPLRAPRPHRRGASRASWRSSASARCGASRRRSCWATRSR